MGGKNLPWHDIPGHVFASSWWYFIPDRD